ncbi:MAG: molybdopterin molybdotransferase MoeA [Bacteroidales bacterium]|nr:molybdopterin molybdotransferase MoeA [Bacteroidales bacterium]
MIRIEEAYKLVTGAVEPMDVENVDVKDSLHRVLAEVIISDVDMPPFNKSAMDGYACRNEDLNKPLRLIETIPAGKEPEKNVGEGECSEIMTGAPVPEGADTVIKVEDTHTDSDGNIIFTGKPGKSNISMKAEDVAKGDVLIDEGTIIEPQHMAILASTGYANLQVSLKPRVAIISTGDEIVEPTQKPGVSKIRNSNAYQLIGQVIKCGAEPHYLGIARDEEEATYNIIHEALENNDVVILTGGISMGQFDFIPAVFEKLHIDVLFQTLAIQPGKPTLFGKYGNKRIFGLPGNPVSAFNTFDLLVKPYLRLSMGAEIGHKVLNLPMGAYYTRKKTDRDSFIPVRIEDGKVFPNEYHGSAHIQALSLADGFIRVPMGTESLKAGELIDVRQI